MRGLPQIISVDAPKLGAAMVKSMGPWSLRLVRNSVLSRTLMRGTRVIFCGACGTVPAHYYPSGQAWCVVPPRWYQWILALGHRRGYADACCLPCLTRLIMKDQAQPPTNEEPLTARLAVRRALYQKSQ